MTIHDNRIDACYGYLKKIMQKIQREEDLSINKEELYNKYMHVIKKCEHKVELKKIALVNLA